MNIGEAVELLKHGQCVRRSGWNGKGMHIYLEDKYSWHLPKVKAAGVFAGQTREYAPVVCLYTAKGIHQPGWVCSQDDLLATDWEPAS
jgi:hypothetical protein